MFDTYIASPTVRGSTTVHVTENRAPTDESVKLLKEMQQEAAASVLYAAKIESNAIKAAFVIHKNCAEMTCWLCMTIFINGEKHTARRKFDEELLKKLESPINEMHAILCEEVTAFLTKELFSQCKDALLPARLSGHRWHD